MTGKRTVSAIQTYQFTPNRAVVTGEELSKRFPFEMVAWDMDGNKTTISFVLEIWSLDAITPTPTPTPTETPVPTDTPTVTVTPTPTNAPQFDHIVVSQGHGGRTLKKILNPSNFESIASFAGLPRIAALLLGGSVERSANTAVADFDGDGVKDVAVGFGPGGLGWGSPSMLVVWSPFGNAGNAPKAIASRGAFSPNASNPLLRNPHGALNLAAGHFVAGETLPMLVAAQGLGGSNQIRVFQLAQVDRGWRLETVGQFQGLTGFAAEKNGSGGTAVAAGDVDGDGLSELIVGQMNGAETAYTTLFQVLDLDKVDGEVIVRRRIRWPVPAMPRAFRGLGGINLAVGDVDGDGEEEIITATAGIPAGANSPALKSFVRVFDVGVDDEKRVVSIRAITPPVQVFDAALNPSGGVDIAAGNLDEDDADELVISTQAIINLDEGTGEVTATHAASGAYVKDLR